MWENGKLLKLKRRGSFDFSGLRYDIVRNKSEVYIVYDGVMLVSKHKDFESEIQDMFIKTYKEKNFTKKRVLDFVEKARKNYKS